MKNSTLEFNCNENNKSVLLFSFILFFSPLCVNENDVMYYGMGFRLLVIFLLVTSSASAIMEKTFGLMYGSRLKLYRPQS